MKLPGPLLALVLLAGCAPTYTLVAAAPTPVARGTLRVTPTMAWNRVPKTPLDVAWEENWTENGLRLDALTFIGGLPDGQAIAKQRRKDDRQVPVFHATMTPQDLVAMVETYYRIRAGATVFTTRSVTPATFVGRPALRFDYAFVGTDQVRRLGRSVIAIDGGKLYMMSLDAAELHYYGAALPAFDDLAATATLH